MLPTGSKLVRVYYLGPVTTRSTRDLMQLLKPEVLGRLEHDRMAARAGTTRDRIVQFPTDTLRPLDRVHAVWGVSIKLVLAYRRAMPGADGSRALWFERLYAYLRLPFLAGALLFGAGLLAAIALVVMIAGDLWDREYLGALIASISAYAVLGLFAQMAARAARRQVERMDEYTKPMRRGRALDLRPLYSPRMAFVTFLGLEIAIRPLYVFSGAEFLTLTQRLLTSVPFLYVDLFAFTFVWVLGYSFYTIYRVGQMELTLRPFTEDRSLGLKPLGLLSLTLTGFYVVLLLLNLVANWPIIQSVAIQALLTAFILLSFGFFLLPLLPLRQKLMKARRDLLDQLSPRLTRVYDTISRGSEARIPLDVVNELTALRAMSADIQQIYSWPFDTGIVVRLSVIVFSVTAITLSQVIAALLGL